MTYLPKPALNRGNPHGYHTRLYTTPYFSLNGNRHHKQSSPITGDQPSYHPKLMEAINQACPSGSEQSFPNLISIWEWSTEFHTFICGSLHLIQITK